MEPTNIELNTCKCACDSVNILTQNNIEVNKIIMYSLIALIILVVILSLYFIYLNKKKKDEKDDRNNGYY